ncbi:MAG: threonine/serine exporter family protein [Lachnospiraceae bacterium]
MTMFLIPGIFPLVPGMGIYQTAQALVGSDWDSGGLQGTDLHQVCCCHRGRHPSGL